MWRSPRCTAPAPPSHSLSPARDPATAANAGPGWLRSSRELKKLQKNTKLPLLECKIPRELGKTGPCYMCCTVYRASPVCFVVFFFFLFVFFGKISEDLCGGMLQHSTNCSGSRENHADAREHFMRVAGKLFCPHVVHISNQDVQTEAVTH